MVFVVPSMTLNHILESFKPVFSSKRDLDLPGVHETTAPFRTGKNVYMLARTNRGLQTLIRNKRHQWSVASNCTLGNAEVSAPNLRYPFHLSCNAWSTNIERDHAPHIVGGIHPESQETHCYMGWEHFSGKDKALKRRHCGYSPTNSDFIGAFPESMRIIPRMYNEGFLVLERDGCRLYAHSEPTLKALGELCNEKENLKRWDHEVAMPANVRFHIDQSFGLMGSSVILVGRAYTPNREECTPVACAYTLGDSRIDHFTPLAHPDQFRGRTLKSVGLFMELFAQSIENTLALYLSTESGLEILQYDSPMVNHIVKSRL